VPDCASTNELGRRIPVSVRVSQNLFCFDIASTFYSECEIAHMPPNSISRQTGMYYQIVGAA